MSALVRSSARPWFTRTVGPAAICLAAGCATGPRPGGEPGTAAGGADTGGAAIGVDLPVVEHVLANGMRFLLLPRPGPPTVSFVVQFPVGSVHDPVGSSGISHFVEHLLFKGSTTIGTTDPRAEEALFARMDAAHDSLVRIRRGDLAAAPAAAEEIAARIEALEDSARAFVVPNEYSRLYSSNGARGLNATTDYESTRYFVELPANRAKLWFVMEADRMRNPVFREFFTERDVILEERRMRVDVSPAGTLYEALMRAAFPNHPYGAPPAGTSEDILALSRPAVREHFDRWYGPNNGIVAIVGDIDPDSLVAWADRYFGPLPPGDPLPPAPTEDSPPTAETRIEIALDAEPEIRIGWRVPSGLSPEGPALNVLASLLVVGRDSRLYRRLVREDRIATSVTVSGGPGSRWPGLFTIQAVPLAPHDVAEVEAAIYEELDRLLIEPPTADELERVARRLGAGEVRRLTSNQGLAFQLADSSALWGDWRGTFTFIDRMGQVDTDDLLELVRRYFVPELRIVAILRRQDPL